MKYLMKVTRIRYDNKQSLISHNKGVCLEITKDSLELKIVELLFITLVELFEIVTNQTSTLIVE